MNSQEFIEVIKLVVSDSSVKSVHSVLIEPPGRAPSTRVVEMSTWFNGLGEKDKTMLLKVVKQTSETSVFGFLCVLDGVRSIDIDIINLGNEDYFICRNDTIFFQDKSFAKIVSVDTSSSEMILGSFISDSIGRYRDINKIVDEDKR